MESEWFRRRGDTSPPLEGSRWLNIHFSRLSDILFRLLQPCSHSDRTVQSSLQPCTPNPTKWPNCQAQEKSWDEQHWAYLVEACKQARMEQGVYGSCAACQWIFSPSKMPLALWVCFTDLFFLKARYAIIIFHLIHAILKVFQTVRKQNFYFFQLVHNVFRVNTLITQWLFCGTTKESLPSYCSL